MNDQLEIAKREEKRLIDLMARSAASQTDLDRAMDRVKHPALSLAELATKCRPPITKAAAHHRLATLRRLADEG